MKLLQKLLQIILFIFFIINNSFAQNISLIRDSETEDLLKEITIPLIKAANLNEKDVTFYIVNDPDVNAFATVGQNIFINTGLIIKYPDPNVLSGVLAHEIGHIAAGHLARTQEEMSALNKLTILSYIAGIAAAAAGNSDAGYAILSGSNQIMQRLAVKHTRTQEEAADKLALQYLRATNNSPAGLLKLLNGFNKDEAEYRNIIDEYALTHPVSQKRINYIKANLNNFPPINENLKLRIKTQLVSIKLRAFIENSDATLKLFKGNSEFDQYGRAIAYFRKGQIENSLREMDNLIKFEPKNGYFHEMKGQILFETGQIIPSIKSYYEAIKLLPNPALAKISMSNAILSLQTKDKDLVNFAIKNLEEVRNNEKTNPQIFIELAKAYQKIGEIGQSYLALAELNLLKKDYQESRKYARLALEKLDNTDKSNRIQAQDILEVVKNEKTSQN